MLNYYCKKRILPGIYLSAARLPAAVYTTGMVSRGVSPGALLNFFPRAFANAAASTDCKYMENNQTSDRELVQRLQTGDQHAFRTLYDRYFGLVLYVSRRCGVDAMEAEDITQETFLKLINKAHTVRDPNAVKGWLVSSARNQAMDILRRKQTQLSKTEQLLHQPENQAHDLIPGSYLRELEVSLVGDLIRKIAVEHNDDILTLFYIDGLSAQEIADRDNTPISTITNRLSRSRKRFREYLAGHIQALRDSMS